MREILFRGKKISDGEWIEGDLLRTTIDCVTYSFIFKDNYTYNKKTGDVTANNRSLVDPATVGQYTGLTDKNGKRIFEGDIIQSWNKSRGKVKYGQHTDCEYGVDAYGWYFFDGDRAISLDESWASHKVIGNVHDNPELIGGGEDG